MCWLTWLAPGKFEWKFIWLILKLSIVKLPSDECQWTLLMMSQHLVQVMAWCHQAPSHYLSQCWPRSMSPYGITRPQCVNDGWLGKVVNHVLPVSQFLFLTRLLIALNKIPQEIWKFYYLKSSWHTILELKNWWGCTAGRWKLDPKRSREKRNLGPKRSNSVRIGSFSIPKRSFWCQWMRKSTQKRLSSIRRMSKKGVKTAAHPYHPT